MGLIDHLFPLFKATTIIAVAVGVVAALRPVLRGRPQWTQETLDIVMAVCEKAVMAIEQAHGNLASVDKKQLAVDMVGQILSRLGIQPPQALVDAAIEAAVLGLNRLFGKVA